MKRTLAGLLVAALLIVQMLGLAHRVTHPGHGQPSTAPRVGATEHHAAQAPAAKGFFAALFAGHAGQRDCDAFDQTSHADVAFASSPVVVAAAAPVAPVVFHAAWHLAAQAHGFLARGPPVFA